MTYQANENTAITWYGQKINYRQGNIDKLLKNIPYFKRIDFTISGGKNSYLDLIVREPMNKNENLIPVATVSKQYSLIQHHEVIAALKEGLDKAGLSPCWQDTELILSDYGERMHFNVTLDGLGFTPDDHCPINLKVNCLNSVDKSTALEINLSWLRLVCSNGMTYGMGSSHLRKIHLRSLNAEDIAEYINQQIEHKNEQETLYKQWLSTEVSKDEIENWIDNDVTKLWGSHAAARVLHISRTGYDGEVKNHFKKTKSHQLTVVRTKEVPGTFPPVNNLFHLSQCLSWVASNRNTIQDRFEKLMQIPKLINELDQK